ncbi:MAG: hypothetical protein ACQESD_03445 [Thermoplasmatota archaeon]
MMDYLMSKMVWIIAAVILTASVIGVFNWQRESLKEVEMEQRADQVSSLIDELINTEGEFKGTVSFNESRDSDFHLSSSLDGESYVLNFTPTGLFLERGSKRCWRGFIDNIHLYSPCLMDSDTETSLEGIDDQTTSIRIESGDDFYIHSKDFEGDFEVFVYPERTDDMGQNVSQIGKEIDDFLDWTMHPEMNMTEINKTRSIRSDTSLEVFPSFILFQNRSAVIPYSTDVVHLWKPMDYQLNSTILESRISENTSYHIEKGEGFVLERTLLLVDENLTVMNFVYKD